MRAVITFTAIWLPLAIVAYIVWDRSGGRPFITLGGLVYPAALLLVLLIDRRKRRASTPPT